MIDRDLRTLRALSRSDPPLEERVAGWVGSWRFMSGMSALLVLWVLANAVAWRWNWDPYPFILLNLLLSVQSVYTAPIILMSQNRDAATDRARAIADYDINVRAEAEVAAIQRKLDLLLAEIGRLHAQTGAAPDQPTHFSVGAQS